MGTDLKMQEVEILRILHKERYINQRKLADISGYSVGYVNKSLKSLLELGLLEPDMSLSESAHQLFVQRRPANAIILAAGFGMRMVPINWTTPKALLELHGERLIERLIRQLHDAGIYDITVVVGFMKESFEYLIDEFGVKLVVNDEYTVKNNLSSLNKVNDRIHNTYVMPSDIWCEDNPFSQDDIHSWYMVSDFATCASDVRVNRKKELVRINRKESGNAMIGISYLTGDICQLVRDRLKEYSADPEYNNRFWEEVLYSEGRMVLPARVVKHSSVAEINTYEQLRDIDSASDQLRSEALDVIADVLQCNTCDIIDIRVLKKGMTNRSFLFTVAGKKYIMRIPGEGTDQLIDRKQEAEVYKVIAGRMLCDDPVYINPDNGYKITGFIENIRCCDPDSDEDLRSCMNKLKKFHSMRLKVSHTFDLFERIDFYESLWADRQSVYPDHDRTKANVLSLRRYISENASDYQLTHIDAVPDNFLFDPGTDGELGLQLTDWEYAGMQDPHVDVAMFAIYSQFEKERIDQLIDLYFEDEGGCCDSTRAKIYCYVAVCGLLWSDWCEYKRNLGVEFGEYSLRQYRFAKDYYKYAVELIGSISD